MTRLLMALIALGIGLSVAACSGAGFATPAASGPSGGYGSPMAGGGG
jgi:hypothetical protein